MTFINEKSLSSSCTSFTATMAGSLHSQIDRFQTIQGLPLFPKQFKDFFSFLKLKDFPRLVLYSRPVQEPCSSSMELERCFCGGHLL